MIPMHPGDDPRHETCCRSEEAVPRPSLAELPDEKALLERLVAGLPRPQDPVERVTAGSRLLAVQAEGRLGLASTLGAAPEPELAEFTGRPLGEVASLLLEDDPIRASLGLAALNAGYPPPPSPNTENAGDLLERMGRGRRVAVVGHFPFVRDLAKVAASVSVVDLRPGLGMMPGPESGRALAECQVLALSATSLLTRTLAGLLAASPHSQKVLLGPSTPWAPALFDLGLDVLAGSLIEDIPAVLEGVAQEVPFFELKRRGVRLAYWAREGLNLT